MSTVAAARHSIFSYFEDFPDPRMDRTKFHRLTGTVAIALCSGICGAYVWSDVERFGKMKQGWFAKFLELPNGILSHDTFGRIFTMLDTTDFYGCLQKWLASLNHTLKDRGVQLDGKTLRGWFDTASEKDARHLRNAWSNELQACLGQVAVDPESNEITAVPKLLEMLESPAAVVTLGTMHYQTETAQAIRNRGAVSILTVRGNPPPLHETIQRLF